MNEIILLGGLVLAAAAGYGARAVLARLEEIPADLEQVVIGFNRCDRCEFAGGHEAAAAHLGDALLLAADQRGISRGQLLGFIARSEVSAGTAPRAENPLPFPPLVLVEERPEPRRIPAAESGRAAVWRPAIAQASGP